MRETLMSNQIAVFIDFENVALWAEQEFLDFELTPLMEYLQSRGPVVLKRCYGDWSRFSRYREELMNNAIDLIQIYSVRAGKTALIFAWRSMPSRLRSRARKSRPLSLFQVIATLVRW